MTDRLAEIRARLDAATSDNRGITFEHRGHDDIIGRYALVREPSLTFAAHAPADIAWLLAEVERMRRDDSVVQSVTNLQRGAS